MRRVTSILLVAIGIVMLGLASATPAGAAATWTSVTWSTTFAQPYSNSEAQGLALGGRLYSFGGFDSLKTCCVPTSRAYRLDPATGWTALAPMPAQNGTSYGGVTHAGMATDGRYIYWAGGYVFNATGTGQTFGTKDVWRYDPAANTYARMPDLPLVRAAGQLAYTGGRLHYFGGTNVQRTAEVGEHWSLDPANPGAGWVARAPLPNPRHHMGAAVVDGKIYAVGGQHGHDELLTTQDDVHAYDPVTDTWTQRADLPKALGHIAAATFALDGRVIVLGGETAHNAFVADTYAYDPGSDRWTALTPLPAPRRSGVADAIDGVLYYSTGSSATTFRGVPGTQPAWPKSFNFQPAGAATPAGYTADTGLAYDPGRGFGWIRQDSLDAASHTPLDVSGGARERNLVSDQRLDTLMHMQLAGKPPAAWELAVPPGTYKVTLSVGDAGAYYDSTHRVNVERGLVLGPFQPSSASRFASVTTTVTVNDGRLTVDAVGGTNTKIDYVVVEQATSGDSTPPDAPTNLVASPGDGRVSLTWSPSAAPDVAGYRVYRSTTTPVSTSSPLSGASLVGGTSFTDTAAQNGTTYHYVVVAVDTSANASSPSASASATPTAGAAAVDLKVNFQPAGAVVPAGYTKDSGLAFDAGRGFGWVRQDSLSSATHVGLDISPNARERNLVSDQRLDTLLHMQYPTSSSTTAVKIPAAWEAVVPAGSYEVTVSVGDAAANFDSSHQINIEDVAAVSAFVPTSGTRFAQATRTVTVADGRLTLDAIGGTNTKIDYVTIRSVTTRSATSDAREDAAIAQFACVVRTPSPAAVA